MKVLFVAAAHHEGDPQRGTSFEYANFLPALRRTACRVERFDAVASAKAVGRVATGQRLMDRVKATQPDVMFTVLFQDELDPLAVEWITGHTRTTTINWFCDDHWRFERYSRRWAPRFNHVVTTDADSLPKYARAGIDNVSLSQWACDTSIYRPVGGDHEYDVTFVGAAHGDRRKLVDGLRRRGIGVTCFGHGWPGGPVPLERMVEIFGRSRINLGFTAASTSRRGLGTWVYDHTHRGLSKLPLLWRTRKAWRRACCGRPPAQIKGRTFEVPACGGLMLTEHAPHLDRYFDIGEEVCVFRGARDAAKRIRELLADEPRRAAIAAAGRRRALAEHTWEHRLAEVWRAAGVDTDCTRREAA